MTENINVQLSVVVCTHNRAGLMAEALEGLCGQAAPSGSLEIIVVDNNSTDSTPRVTADYAGRYPWVRYCLEPRLGLSWARNTGYQAARGEYVAYIDDDCQVPPGWASAALKIIAEHRPGVFGGPYFAAYKSSRPRWYKDEYGSNTLGDQARPLEPDEYVNGGNMVFLRTILVSTGGFETDLGQVAGRIGFGEETALIRMVRAKMPEQLIYYSPTLFVYHLVRPEKMSVAWRIRETYAIGRDSYRVFRAGTPLETGWRNWVKDTLRAVWYLLLDLGRGLFARDRSRYPYIENYIYEAMRPNIVRLGELSERIQQLRGR
jgi:glycosyltransferase involved in cell wall biosynthesis